MAHLEEVKKSKYTTLSAGDFPNGRGLKLKFEDNSYVVFRYVPVIEALELGEIGVFTEHCGYHVFPLYGTQVSWSDT